MAKIGRPKGSKTKNSSRPFADALRKALHDRPDRKGPRNLELVARAAVKAAMEGKGELIREIADRIDGKVPQALVGDDSQDAIRVIARIERTIVKPG